MPPKAIKTITTQKQTQTTTFATPNLKSNFLIHPMISITVFNHTQINNQFYSKNPQ